MAFDVERALGEELKKMYERGYDHGFWGGVFLTVFGVSALLLITHFFHLWDIMRIDNL